MAPTSATERLDDDPADVLCTWEMASSMRERFQELEERLSALERRVACPGEELSTDILKVVGQRLESFEGQIATRLLSMQRGLDKRLASSLAHLARNMSDLEAMAINRLAETPAGVRQDVSHLDKKLEELKLDVEVLKDLAIGTKDAAPRETPTLSQGRGSPQDALSTGKSSPFDVAGHIPAHGGANAIPMQKQVVVPSVSMAVGGDRKSGGVGLAMRQSSVMNATPLSIGAQKSSVAAAAVPAVGSKAEASKRPPKAVAAATRQTAAAQPGCADDKPSKPNSKPRPELAGQMTGGHSTGSSCVSLVTGAPLSRHRRMPGKAAEKPAANAPPPPFQLQEEDAIRRIREAAAADLEEDDPSDSEGAASPKPFICVDDLEAESECSYQTESRMGTPVQSPQRLPFHGTAQRQQLYARADSPQGYEKEQPLEPWFRRSKAAQGLLGGRRNTGSTVVSEETRSYDLRDDDYGSGPEDEDHDLGLPLPGWSKYTTGDAPADF
eukprot:TRINITY_DN6948_c0_g2_i1.p1 TRINITY_DN6948_c0_g2~~TRINITY_DN6948_c0_g2_i1.p1  ORF type:complete len:497 (+),score=135.16 TRINITY_DN6948_c0_g2_i1:99-1589(+)